MDTNKGKERELRKGRLPMNAPAVVSAREWEAARQHLLVKEKELTRARDGLAAERRRMPWLAVEQTATRFSAPTSSTIAATSRWAAPGTISTSPRSDDRRSGKTRRRATRKRRRTSGGTGTTTTSPRPRLTRSGSRCPTPEKLPSESGTQRQEPDRGSPERTFGVGCLDRMLSYVTAFCQ